MKFTFKMCLLVGMILVGKFLKEDSTDKIGVNENQTTEDSYTMNMQESFPFIQQTKNVTQPTIKKVSSEKTYTYSIN
jgi:hypothetical protein